VRGHGQLRRLLAASAINLQVLLALITRQSYGLSAGTRRWHSLLLRRGALPASSKAQPNIARLNAGFQFTFVRKPHLTFDISLKGMLFSEVPGLVGELKRRLLQVIASEAVEPARVWVNLCTPFYNLVTRKQTGKRGQVKVRLWRRMVSCHCRRTRWQVLHMRNTLP
jgi:hypothetical protein